MIKVRFPALAMIALATAVPGLAAPRVEPAHDYPFKPVPFTEVHLDDVFWAPRLETNRLTTIPFAFEQCEKSGRMDNFIRAAKVLRGDTNDRRLPGFPFDDTDPYKVLEGASYDLSVEPDPKMEDYLNHLIALIGSAQEPDGYLYTARTINPAHPHSWSGPKRWLNDPEQSHELYDAGHLFQAAVAHYQATGETNLLAIAIKEANLLCDTFGPKTNQLNHIWPGHEVVEMGLTGLYRVTGDERYLRLAKFFIDCRGPGGDDYHQSRIKPVDQTEATGHAVRAGYLYSGMADVAALTGDADYVKAIDAIWKDVVDTKLYVTGGIGAKPQGEAFGPAYYLPNDTAYCETCAAVANAYWNQRLFLLHGDSKYVDVLERVAYNGLLSGVSLDGKTFFYPNPLSSDGHYQRSPWFGCACCPGNIVRWLPSLPGCFYAERGDELYINLFAANHAKIKLDNGETVNIDEETRYPWDGDIKLTLHPTRAGRFTVKVRIPGWSREEPVPSSLYRFADAPSTAPTLTVNNKPQKIAPQEGYAAIKRKWKDGDVIELTLPMPVRRLIADSRVEADRNRVALQRGPLVYCLESPDNPGQHVREAQLPAKEPLSASFDPTLLNGIEVIHAGNLSAIPCYAWANRGPAEMEVWIEEFPHGQ